MTLKSDTSRTKHKETSGFKRWAAIGALGMASVFGSPVLIGTAHAQPQQAQQPGAQTRAQTQAARTPQQLIQMINAIAPAPAQARATAAPEQANPVSDTNPGNLSSTCISVFRIWEVVNSRPAESDPMRPVYDRAVQAWGGESQAREAVSRSFRQAVENLRQRAASRTDCGHEAAGLEYVVSAIEQNLSEGNEQYSRSFDSSWGDVSAVRRVLRGGEQEVGLSAERERVTSRTLLPLIDLPLFDPGTDHFLNGFGSVQAVAYDGRLSQDMILVFGSEGVARESLNALANAYAAAYSPNASASDQAAAARALHSALSQIPSGREIWTHDGFRRGMDALARGDLRTGLGYLQGEGLLQTAYDQLNNLHQVTLSQRALVRLRAGVNVRLFNFTQNQQEFAEFRRGTRDSGYNWDILDISLGAHYINLLVSGYDQRYSVDRASGSLLPVGGRTRVDGDGGAFELTPSLTWGANVGGPATMTLFGSFGYRWWKIETDVATSVGTRTLTAEDQNFYVGLWGLHINLLGYEGRTAPFRLESVGIGASGVNPLAYATMGWRYAEGNHWRLNGRLTPRYTLFHGERPEGFASEYFFQHRFGLDVRPIESMHQFSEDWSLNFGPGFNYILATEFDGADRIVHTLEPYAYAGLNSQRYGFAMDARFGGHFEAGGQEWQRLPSSPYGMLTVTLTPERWFNQDQPSRARPAERSGSVGVGARTGGGSLEVQAEGRASRPAERQPGQGTEGQAAPEKK